MSLLKAIWGLLFRLFPCPTPVGLRRVGAPGPGDPVLVTCNFDLTVRRLTRVLRRAKIDAWLLVAESKGVNVWCAAGAEEFNTRSVVSVVKTSGIADRVDRRRLILPPFSAPGVCADKVRKETGWSIRWGPAYLADLPRYLAGNGKRDDGMRRARYAWAERLDTALGSLFLFYLVGAIGFALLGRGLLADYLLVGALAFVAFFSACPWIPGRHGLTKALLVDAILAGALIAGEWFAPDAGFAFRPHLIIAMVMFPLYGLELGGLASTLPSDLDPFLARLGVESLGNVYFAGKVRTDLLNGVRELVYEPALCNGCRHCHEVCPVGVWEMDGNKRAVMAHRESCTACRGCLVQCTPGAITAPRVADR